MLCENRFPLPGSPSTCTLDTALVPLPSFFLFLALAAHLVLSRRGNDNNNAMKLTPSRWGHIIYLVLVGAQIAITILELVRLALENLGVGLLPVNTVGLLVVFVLLWRERTSGRTMPVLIILAAYWFFLAIFLAIKTARLHRLEQLNPTTTKTSQYPSSDWFLDNAVMLGLYVVFFVYECINLLRLRRQRQRAHLQGEGGYNLKLQSHPLIVPLVFSLYVLLLVCHCCCCPRRPRSFPFPLAAPAAPTLLTASMMHTSPRDLAYSLFGAPLFIDVGPSVNGEIVRVRVQPINTISVTALVISLLLFIGFMCFYLYPLFRARRVPALRTSTTDAEPGSPTDGDQEDTRTLLSWLHFRSRERFSTAAQLPPPLSNDKSPLSLSPNPGPAPLARQPSRRVPASSFTRGSLIPHLSPTLTPPPPVYASRPNSPLASSVTDFRFPASARPGSPRFGTSSNTSPRGSPTLAVPAYASRPSSPRPRSASSSPTPAVPSPAYTSPRVQFAPHNTLPGRPSSRSPGRARSNTATGAGTSPTLAMRPFTAPRSVSAHTVAAVSAAVPSSARVYAGEAAPSSTAAATASENGDGDVNGANASGNTNTNASNVRRVARLCDNTQAGLGIGISGGRGHFGAGIGLAERGRILTRGPSSGRNYGSAIGAGGVGSPF